MISGFNLETKGPAFDGVLEAAVVSSLIDAKLAVAKEGENMIRNRLASVLQNSSGFYASQIQTDRIRNNVVINDSKTVYGPWLEGQSSLNRKSRFKGYKTFRITKRELQGKAPTIAQLRVYGKVQKVTA